MSEPLPDLAPMPLVRVNGHVIRPWFRIESRPARYFNTLADAVDAAEKLPPKGEPDPFPTGGDAA